MAHTRRKLHIAKVLAKHGFGFVLAKAGLGYLLPFHWGVMGHRKKKEPYREEEHLRLAFEELGVTFIKIGQILSTRPDIMPESYILELSKLQDRVPPSEPEQIRRIIEEELGKPVEEVFEYFEDEPLASASIGQVHRARLKDGKEVVLKVQKPGVEKEIEEDLAILEEFAERASRTELGRRWNIQSLVEEFSYTIRNELDYIREGRNCETFRKNFQDYRGVYMPEVYWDYTTRRVLCLEYVEGIKINSVPELTKAGYDLRALAKRGARIYIKMIFEDGFFHADPHPGNFLVMKDGRIALLDYGMVGTVSNMDRLNLFQLMYGILRNDLDLVMDALYDLGVSARTRSEKFLSRELEILFSYYFMQPVREVKLSKVVNDTLRLSYKYRMKLPSDLFLLLKTLALAEGTAIQLDPDFRLVKEIEPLVKKGFRRMIFPMLTKSEFVKNTLMLTKLGLEAVPKTKKFLRELERGELRVSVDYTGEEKLIEDLRKDINRLAMSVITLGFMIATAIILLFVVPHLLKEFVVYLMAGLTILMVLYGFVKLRKT
ncbi:MAG: lipopolysaccharide core heptose(II) kinase RfaY [Aquificaceae bacterium]|jgi:ubiquinone biosynthesis protein|uniref:ABC1 kinase family protein n=1 Tax=Hydrogenobacter sp. Uz 6-8 TaxID=3384828 RepID=UPI0030AA98E9